MSRETALGRGGTVEAEDCLEQDYYERGGIRFEAKLERVCGCKQIR